jgi:hypothetical protein
MLSGDGVELPRICKHPFGFLVIHFHCPT